MTATESIVEIRKELESCDKLSLLMLAKLRDIENKLKALETIGRICASEDTYIETEDRFYIDGCTNYLSQEEKDKILIWLKSIKK